MGKDGDREIGQDQCAAIRSTGLQEVQRIDSRAHDPLIHPLQRAWEKSILFIRNAEAHDRLNSSGRIRRTRHPRGVRLVALVAPHAYTLWRCWPLTRRRKGPRILLRL